ncbi:112_t:CDS:2, partial [Racocetra persica]
ERREEIEKTPVDTEIKTDMPTSLITAKMTDEDIREVIQKMLSEIDSKLSDGLCVKRDDLLKLKYCDAIIKETGRLMAVAVITLRYITSEREVAGYKWPAVTHFILSYSGRLLVS